MQNNQSKNKSISVPYWQIRVFFNLSAEDAAAIILEVPILNETNIDVPLKITPSVPVQSEWPKISEHAEITYEWKDETLELEEQAVFETVSPGVHTISLRIPIIIEKEKEAGRFILKTSEPIIRFIKLRDENKPRYWRIMVQTLKQNFNSLLLQFQIPEGPFIWGPLLVEVEEIAQPGAPEKGTELDLVNFIARCQINYGLGQSELPCHRKAIIDSERFGGKNKVLHLLRMLDSKGYIVWDRKSRKPHKPIKVSPEGLGIAGKYFQYFEPEFFKKAKEKSLL
jgi:hypothetical protein